MSAIPTSDLLNLIKESLTEDVRTPYQVIYKILTLLKKHGQAVSEELMNEIELGNWSNGDRSLALLNIELAPVPDLVSEPKVLVRTGYKFKVQTHDGRELTFPPSFTYILEWQGNELWLKPQRSHDNPIRVRSLILSAEEFWSHFEFIKEI